MMDKGKGIRLIFNVILLIFSAVLLVSIIRLCFGGSTFSFTNFLSYASNVPQIDVNYTPIAEVSGTWPDWILWFKYVLIAFSHVINVVWWIMRNVANLILFIGYFVTLLFI